MEAQQTFENIVLRMGTFHTICTFLSIIEKRLEDAGLKDIFVESGVLAEGSVAVVLEGRKYNRAIRVHKLMYEAFMRLSWSGFQTWLEENQQNMRLVNAVYDNIKKLVLEYLPK